MGVSKYGGDAFAFSRFLRSGRYHTGSIWGANTPYTLTANYMYAIPFYVSEARTVDSVAIHVTTAGAANSKARIGIYRDNGAGYPKERIEQSAELSVDSTGIKESTGLSIPLNSSTLYWLVLHNGAGTPAVAGMTVGQGYPLLGYTADLNVNAANIWGLSRTYTSPLPNPMPTAGRTEFAVNVPKIAVKWSAPAPTFAYNLALLVDPENSGAIDSDPPEVPYEEETVVTLTAVPVEIAEFSHWSGDLEGSDNPTTIEMNENKEVTANFTWIEYDLAVTIDPVGEGTVELDPPGETYIKNTEVELTAIDPAEPESGDYVFDEWSGDLSGSENPETIVMTDHKDVTANYVLIYDLHIERANQPGAGAHFTVSPEPYLEITDTTEGESSAEYEGLWKVDTVIEVTAVAGEGKVFEEWTGDVPEGHETDNPVSITLDADKEIMAHFVNE